MTFAAWMGAGFVDGMDQLGQPPAKRTITSAEVALVLRFLVLPRSRDGLKQPRRCVFILSGVQRSPKYRIIPILHRFFGVRLKVGHGERQPARARPPDHAGSHPVPAL